MRIKWDNDIQYSVNRTNSQQLSTPRISSNVFIVLDPLSTPLENNCVVVFGVLITIRHLQNRPIRLFRVIGLRFCKAQIFWDAISHAINFKS